MNNDRPFEFRAGMQLVQSLLLRETDIPSIRTALETTVAQAPAMFQGAPVTLDLQPLQSPDAVPDFVALTRLFQEMGMVPAGVRNAGADQQQAAKAAGWALLADRRDTPTRGEGASRGPAQVVRHPVRSGQQVYAPGDLVLMAPVSAGAEVLAGGSIHVYAPLRGKALAGVKGDVTAQIFCLALHAELLSIAGHYQALDDLEEHCKGQPAQIRLDGERLVMETT